jgi:hypothetical protein
LSDPLEKAKAYYSNISVEIYLSPVSGKITTIVLPSFSGRCETWIAAHKAAPELIPANIPSFTAN